MVDCTNIPTLETVQDFNKDAKVLTEVVTSNVDQTTQTDSLGNTHQTLAGLYRSVGYTIVGDFSDVTKVEITSPNQVYTSKSIVGYEDVQWRTNQELPYTPTGNDPTSSPELGKWVLVGQSELKSISRSLNVIDDNVSYLGLISISGVNYLYHTASQTTYYSPVALTGTISDIGTDVDGVRTITVDTVPYEIKKHNVTDKFVFETVSDLQLSTWLSLGDEVRIRERNNSNFLVTNDTPNGYDKVDIDGNITATLIVTPLTTISSFGEINTSDDTDVFQAAIDGCNGNLIIDGTVSYTSVSVTDNLKITGYGAVGLFGDATLNQISATLDGIDSTGANDSLHVDSVHLTSSVSKTSGVFVKITTGTNAKIENCTFSKHFRGVSIDDSLSTTIRNCVFKDAVPGATVAGSAHIVLAENARNDTVNITSNFSFLVNETLQPSYGVLVYYQDVLFATDNNFIQAGAAFAIVPKSGQTASLIYITSGEMDTSDYGVVIAPEAGGVVARVVIQPKWIGVMSGDGVRIDGSLGTVQSVMVGGEVIITGITGNGVSAFGDNVDDLQIDNANVSGSAIGIRVVDTATKLRISNCVVGAVSGANPNVDGVVIGANVTGSLTNNDFSGNSGTNLSNNSANVTEFGNKPYTWTSYTPTVAAGAGSLISYTATGRYRLEGGVIHFQVVLTITDNGTGSGNIQFSLPKDATQSSIVSGRGTGVSGKMVQAQIATNVGIVYNYDGTYPASTGEVLVISGSYEI